LASIRDSFIISSVMYFPNAHYLLRLNGLLQLIISYFEIF
jgi:hypothetical protein